METCKAPTLQLIKIMKNKIFFYFYIFMFKCRKKNKHVVNCWGIIFKLLFIHSFIPACSWKYVCVCEGGGGAGGGNDFLNFI